jgi:hypothetical protein
MFGRERPDGAGSRLPEVYEPGLVTGRAGRPVVATRLFRLSANKQTYRPLGFGDTTFLFG